jgi:hypothetical protein
MCCLNGTMFSVPLEVLGGFETRVRQLNMYNKKKTRHHMPTLPINKMLYIYVLCPHSEHKKNLF